MKALSIRQPYASLIAEGQKTLEIRSWRTKYRGPLLICSTARPANIPACPPGVTVCVVDLVDVRPLEPDDLRAAAFPASMPWRPGQYAWVLENPRRVRQVAVRGQLGLWNYTQ